jgi:DNA-binding response OmpR family regulator
MAQTILICEDDRVLSNLLQQRLRDAGYATVAVREGREALQYAQGASPDMLLLDLVLPDMDGFDVCRRLRAFSSTPVIMISARTGETDRIVGLELGADDYLVKPFGAEEMVARVEAHLRRSLDYSLGLDPGRTLDIGDLHLDPAGREVLLGGNLIHLTPKEFDLLCALAENLGSVVRSSQLLLRVWGYDSAIRTRTLDVHIGRLRTKIEADTSQPRYIVTVPGVGYRLCAPETMSSAT